MTKEELKAHCERQVQQFERFEKIIPVTPNDWKRYEEHKLILELLGQETKESKDIHLPLYKVGDRIEPGTDGNAYKLSMSNGKEFEQQSSEDCVSRAELKKWLDMNFSFGGALRKLELFDRLDKELPSVTPTFNKWHLVKDELPNKCNYVNITCRSLIDTRPDWVVETCYVPQYPSSPYSDWGNIPMLNNGECEVIAWMYRNIPEPYKPER